MVDPSSDLAGLGVGALVAMLILREVFGFLRDKKAGSAGQSWQRDLERHVSAVSGLLKEQTEVLRQIGKDQLHDRAALDKAHAIGATSLTIETPVGDVWMSWGGGRPWPKNETVQ